MERSRDWFYVFLIEIVNVLGLLLFVKQEGVETLLLAYSFSGLHVGQLGNFHFDNVHHDSVDQN